MTGTATFTDTAGREWHLALDYQKLRAIRSATGLDFGETERVAEHWSRILASDTVALDVIWIALADRTAGVSQDQWLSAMDGQRLEAAREALLAAIINFTPPLKKGMVEEGAVVVMKRYKEAIQQAEATIRELTEATTKAALDRLGIAPPSAPASSAISTNAGA
jgi:hypothetical protein